MLPMPDGQTICEWARKLAARKQGPALDVFRQQNGITRDDDWGIGRFRASLRDELEDNPALPATIEADVFSGIDVLSQRRAETNPGG